MQTIIFKYNIIITKTFISILQKIESLIAEKDFLAKRLEGVMNKLEQNKHIIDLNNGYKGIDL
jgi:hypothetical protein